MDDSGRWDVSKLSHNFSVDVVERLRFLPCPSHNDGEDIPYWMESELGKFSLNWLIVAYEV